MQGLPPGVIPYCGLPPSPGDLWARWNLDPLLIAALAGFLALYAAGRRKLRDAPDAPNGGAFLAGWLVTSLALVSPLCPLSVSLFSARVGQHMLMTLVGAPLVALGSPVRVMTAALAKAPPGPLRPSAGRAIMAAIAFAVLLWVWHAPGPYYGAFLSPAVYWEMHVTLYGSALWLWSELLTGEAAPVSLAASALTMLQMGLLGALVTLSPRALYSPHQFTTWSWGLTPLQDQQLGGAIMWAPGEVAFLLAALWVGVRLMRPRLAHLSSRAVRA